MVSGGTTGTNPAKPTNTDPEEDLFGDDGEDMLGGEDGVPAARIEFRVLTDET